MALQNYLFNAQNETYNPGIEILDDNYQLSPTGDVSSNLAQYPSQWYTPVAYKGAINSNGNNWLDTWTLLSQSGKI